MVKLQSRVLPVQSRANVTTRERTTDRNIGTSTRTTTTARDRTQERTTSQNPGISTRSTTATAERNRDLATGKNTGPQQDQQRQG